MMPSTLPGAFHSPHDSLQQYFHRNLVEIWKQSDWEGVFDTFNLVYFHTSRNRDAMSCAKTLALAPLWF